MPKSSTPPKLSKSSKPGKGTKPPSPQTIDKDLTARVRLALAKAGVTEIQEKKMFGGTAFMIGGLMCVTARPERLMCRIDPETHDQALGREGCSSMEIKGRIYRGYVFVASEVVESDRNLKAWLSTALAYNRHLTEGNRKKTPKPAAKRK